MFVGTRKGKGNDISCNVYMKAQISALKEAFLNFHGQGGGPIGGLHKTICT